MGEHVWAEIQMVWTAAGREAVAYSEQGGRLGAGEILTMLNEHAALKRENEMLREFVELTQSKWEEFGCDDGIVTVKYPWAIQERMREIALLIEEQEK